MNLASICMTNFLILLTLPDESVYHLQAVIASKAKQSLNINDIDSLLRSS